MRGYFPVEVGGQQGGDVPADMAKAPLAADLEIELTAHADEGVVIHGDGDATVNPVKNSPGLAVLF